MTDMHELTEAWSNYLLTVGDWKGLVAGVEPKVGGCGLVYELDNPIDRPGESFAIADMRQLEMSEPHLHKNGETEIYFVLTGIGTIAVGDTTTGLLEPQTYIVTPPDTIHITLPRKDLVLAVVNTPRFNPDNYQAVSSSKKSVVKMIARLRAEALLLDQ